MTTTDRWQSIIETILTITVPLVIGYHLWYMQNPIIDPIIHRIIHLGCCFYLMILLDLRKNRKWWPLKAALLAVGLGITGYFLLSFGSIIHSPVFLPIPVLVAGVIALLVVFLLTWYEFGRVFPIIALIGICYMVFGWYIPGPLRSPRVPVTRIISWLSADITAEWGLYGSLVSISANYLFMLMLLGSFLQAFGGDAMRFIRSVGDLFSSKLRSGPAALSVFTSALTGTITGSTVANVSITGSFTIPLMKSAGYAPEHAAAIETTASNGGQILPPVMGIAAFVMAGYTGIPYLEIAKAALIPALIYYVIVLTYIQLVAAKLGLMPKPVKTNFKTVLQTAPNFLVPILLLVIFLWKNYSLMLTTYYAVVSCILLNVLSSVKGGRILRPSYWLETKETIFKGCYSAASTSVLVGLLGVVVSCVEVTGLGLKLGDALIELARGNLFLLLCFAFVAALVLGAGIPTEAVYILTATMFSPALVKLGVPLLQAHLSPFVFATSSHFTPPIALGLIVACQLASAKYLPAAKEALKAAFPTFLLPFFFVYAPGLVLQFPQGLAVGIVEILVAVIAFISLEVAFNRRCFVELTNGETLTFFVAGALSCAYLFLASTNYLIAIIAIMLFGTVLANNLMHARRFSQKSLPAKLP